MRELIASGLAVVILSISNVAVATEPENTAPPQLTSAPVNQSLPPSFIDGIEVPFEVLEYAQMQYQGYAVTKVSRAYHNGQPAYRLLIDNDDIPYNGGKTIYLLYDMQWKLIGEDSFTQSVHAHVKQEAPQPTEPTQSVEQQPISTAPETPVPDDTPTEPEAPDPTEQIEPQGLQTPPTIPQPGRSRRNLAPNM